MCEQTCTKELVDKESKDCKTVCLARKPKKTCTRKCADWAHSGADRPCEYACEAHAFENVCDERTSTCVKWSASKTTCEKPLCLEYADKDPTAKAVKAKPSVPEPPAEIHPVEAHSIADELAKDHAKDLDTSLPSDMPDTMPPKRPHKSVTAPVSAGPAPTKPGLGGRKSPTVAKAEHLVREIEIKKQAALRHLHRAKVQEVQKHGSTPAEVAARAKLAAAAEFKKGYDAALKKVKQELKVKSATKQQQQHAAKQNLKKLQKKQEVHAMKKREPAYKQSREYQNAYSSVKKVGASDTEAEEAATQAVAKMKKLHPLKPKKAKPKKQAKVVKHVMPPKKHKKAPSPKKKAASQNATNSTSTKANTSLNATHTSGKNATHTSGKNATHTLGKNATHTSGKNATHTSAKNATHASAKNVSQGNSSHTTLTNNTAKKPIPTLHVNKSQIALQTNKGKPGLLITEADAAPDIVAIGDYPEALTLEEAPMRDPFPTAPETPATGGIHDTLRTAADEVERLLGGGSDVIYPAGTYPSEASPQPTEPTQQHFMAVENVAAITSSAPHSGTPATLPRPPQPLMAQSIPGASPLEREQQAALRTMEQASRKMSWADREVDAITHEAEHAASARGGRDKTKQKLNAQLHRWWHGEHAAIRRADPVANPVAKKVVAVESRAPKTKSAPRIKRSNFLAKFRSKAKALPQSDWESKMRANMKRDRAALVHENSMHVDKSAVPAKHHRSPHVAVVHPLQGSPSIPPVVAAATGVHVEAKPSSDRLGPDISVAISTSPITSTAASSKAKVELDASKAKLRAAMAALEHYGVE